MSNAEASSSSSKPDKNRASEENAKFIKQFGKIEPEGCSNCTDLRDPSPCIVVRGNGEDCSVCYRCAKQRIGGCSKQFPRPEPKPSQKPSAPSTSDAVSRGTKMQFTPSTLPNVTQTFSRKRAGTSSASTSQKPKQTKLGLANTEEKGQETESLITNTESIILDDALDEYEDIEPDPEVRRLMTIDALQRNRSRAEYDARVEANREEVERLEGRSRAQVEVIMPPPIKPASSVGSHSEPSSKGPSRKPSRMRYTTIPSLNEAITKLESALNEQVSEARSSVDFAAIMSRVEELEQHRVRQDEKIEALKRKLEEVAGESESEDGNEQQSESE